MKTSFNIAWVDDNFNDDEMGISNRLSRKLARKNGFSLVVKDVYDSVKSGGFDVFLSNLVNTIDLSNSFDLILVDYELGKGIASGDKIAKKIRAKLPSIDIVFYSGKQGADGLRQLIAKENIDGVNCIGRQDLDEGAYTVIENIINRSYKISTLRGLILNSVCEMDHMIREILCKYGEENMAQESVVKNKAIELLGTRDPTKQSIFKNESIENLLSNNMMMSGKLFSVLDKIKNNLGLNKSQKNLLSLYRSEILDLRGTAAHAKEATCQATGQSMLKNKGVEYKRSGIDHICKTIVKHEKNIQSILGDMN